MAAAQVHTLLKGLEKIANSANIPMVVAGDLNSVPGSAPHVLVLEKRVDVREADVARDPLNLFADPTAGANKVVSHSLTLRSAYSAAALAGARQSEELTRLRSQLDNTWHEPRYTNVTRDFRATLDYLVCSSPELQPTALLELPSLDELLGENPAGGLPNAQWPSDHLALMAEFQFSRPGPNGA